MWFFFTSIRILHIEINIIEKVNSIDWYENILGIFDEKFKTHRTIFDYRQMYSLHFKCSRFKEFLKLFIRFTISFSSRI